MCQDWILFVNDFSINKAPESNGRKFYLTNSGTPSPSGNFTGSAASGVDTKTAAKPSTPKSALARVRLWAGGDGRNRYDTLLCLPLFHRWNCALNMNYDYEANKVN